MEAMIKRVPVTHVRLHLFVLQNNKFERTRMRDLAVTLQKCLMPS